MPRLSNCSSTGVTMTKTESLGPFKWKYAKAIIDAEGLDKLTSKVRAADRVFLDVETTGVDPADTVRLVQIGLPDEKTVYLLDPNSSKSTLKAVVKYPTIIAHNAAFDLVHLTKFLFPSTEKDPYRPYEKAIKKALTYQVICTMTAFQISRSIGWYPSLAMLSHEAGVHNRWAEQFNDLPYKNPWRDAPINEPTYLKYAAHDIRQLRAVYNRLLESIPVEFDALILDETIAGVLYHILRDMGMRVDSGQALSTYTDLYERAEDLVAKLVSRHGVSSPNSGASIAAALEAAGYKHKSFTATGKASMSRSVLVGIQSPKKARKIAQDVMSTRSAVKDAGAVKSLIEHTTKYGRIHPDLKRLSTATGRSSCANPNLQQLNKHQGDKRVRGILCAEKGERVASIDFSNMEVRVIADMARDVLLRDQLLDGYDVHGGLAEQVGIERQLAKIGIFALLYGASDRAIAKQTGMSRAQADQLRSAWEKSYPDVFKASRRWTSEAVKTGRVLLPNGWNPEVGRTGNKVAAYRAVNYMIQGMAAFIFRRAAIQVAEAGLWSHVRMVVHDEFVCSVPLLGNHGQEIANAAVVRNDFMTYHTDIEFWGNQWGIKEVPGV